jgi:hypothetical protein
MRPGHARDNCRHIEIHLPAVGDFSGHWWIVSQPINVLLAADRHDDGEHTDETPAKDPLM